MTLVVVGTPKASQQRYILKCEIQLGDFSGVAIPGKVRGLGGDVTVDDIIQRFYREQWFALPR